MRRGAVRSSSRFSWTGAGDNRLLGYASGDAMNGKAGHDSLRGLDGNDTINGQSGDEALDGGHGGDDLAGGAGDDRLTSGRGSDTFIFRDLRDGTVETDTIADHRAGQIDTIDLAGAAAHIAGEERVAGVWELTLTATAA
jgi:Ca2+-binding RTX toxin-like protein